MPFSPSFMPVVAAAVPDAPAPAPDYTGSGPGFDLADIYDWPLQNVLKPAASAVETVVGPVERPVATALSNRPWSDVVPSIWDPERGASWEQAAKDAAPAWYKEYPRLTTFGTAVLGSPLTYLSAGTTSLGRQAISKGAASLSQVARGAKVATEVAAPLARTGLAETLAGRLRAGQTGLQVGVPFSEKLRVPLTPVNWALGKGLEPLEGRLSALKTLVEATPVVGKGLVRGAEKTGEFLFGVPPHGSVPAGQVQMQAEGLGVALRHAAEASPEYRTILAEGARTSPEANKVAMEMGDALWRMEDGEALLRGRAAELVGQANVPEWARAGKAGQAVPLAGPTEAVLRTIAPKLAALSADEQAAAFLLSKKMVELAHKTRQAAEGLGATIPGLDDALRAEVINAEKALRDLRAVPKPDPKELAAAEAALKLARERLSEVPAYIPRRASEEVLTAAPGGRLPGMAREGIGSGLHERQAYTEGEVLAGGVVGEKFKGVPRHYAAQEAAMLSSGAPVLSAGEMPTKTPSFLDAFRNLIRPSGAKEFAREAADVLESNPARAAERYISGVAKEVTAQNLETRITRVARAVPVAAWDAVVREAKAGASVAALRKTWAGLGGEKTYGALDELLLAQGYPAKGLRNLKGFAKMDGFAGGNYYVPVPWAESYAKYVRWTYNPARELARAAPLLTQVASMFKLGSTQFFPLYHIRNFVGDVLRMQQGGLIGTGTARDFGTLFQHAWPKYVQGGWPHWDELTGTIRLAGGVERPLGDFVKDTLKAGLSLNHGRTASTVYDAYEIGFEKALARGVTTSKSSVAKLARGAMFHEDVTRLSGVAELMRRGYSLDYAVARTEQVMFNYSKVSPFVDLARRFALAPFLSWQAKNIPYQMEWALSHPGDFLVLRKAWQMANDGTPKDVLNKFVRERTNYDLQVDKEGNITYRTASGLLPLADLADLFRDPGGYLTSIEGPLIKLAVQQQMDENEEETRTPLWKRMWDAEFGRPTQAVRDANRLLTGQVDERTGKIPPQSVPGKLLQAAVWTFDPGVSARQGGKIQSSLAKEEAVAEKHEGMLSGLIGSLRRTLLMSSVTNKISADDPALADVRGKLETAQGQLQQMKQRHAAERRERLKASAMLLGR